MKKILSALLALLTVGSMLISCSGGGDTPNVTTAGNADTDASVETTSKDPDADDLPADLDFGGKSINIYGTTSKMYRGPDEDTGDVVDAAVIERNNAVETRLNIDIGYKTNEADPNDVGPSMENLVLSGDSTYDLFIYRQYSMSPMMLEGYFINVNDLDYMDFDKPYWNKNYMDEVTLNTDKRYFLMGDYFVDSLLQLRVSFYNKTMYGDRYGDPDGLYQIVMDGEWTLDKMTQLIADAYEDLNNNGATDKDDRLGQICWALAGTVDPFVYGTDLEFTKRTADGGIEITMMSEEAVTLAEKLNALFNQPGNFVVSSNEHRTIFKNGNAQFMAFAKFTDATELRDMEADFGFLPHPKFDDEQDEYKSLIHDSCAPGAIPVTAQNTDIIGAVLEALNYETMKTVTPTWYETALKIKYARDDISTQMIDLIHNSATTHFIYAYNYALNGLGLIYRDLVTKNSNDFASTYATKEPAALEALAELTEYFNS